MTKTMGVCQRDIGSERGREKGERTSRYFILSVVDNKIFDSQVHLEHNKIEKQKKSNVQDIANGETQCGRSAARPK